MSSEHASLQFPLRGVVLMGGGRWSRVLLPIIRSLLSENANIVWVIEHGFDRAQAWLKEKSLDRVTVQQSWGWDVHAIDAAVVATSPVAHAEQVRRLLEMGIPTFCEKPFTLDFDEAEKLVQLSTSTNCVLGIDLEMHLASFVEDFVALISNRNISEVSIVWIDPWMETRYGELKHGDVFTSIVDDMWPHCWSLLRKLSSRRDDAHFTITSVEEVDYQPSSGQVEIQARFDTIHTKVVLSRRGEKRVRKVIVNGGEAILDFSVEPGFTELDGVISSNVWRGARPLSRALSSFFEVVVEPKRVDNWALSANACLDSVKSAQVIGSQLRILQEKMLNDMRREGVAKMRVGDRNLIVDLLLPQYAARGDRWPAITEDEQTAFVEYVCKEKEIDCK